MTYLQLFLVALVPVVQTVIIYLVFKKGLFRRYNYIYEQIIIGILYGILSSLATEFGVNIGNATLNVRDVAPLCASLVFGGPSGIIAGFIGGIERLLSPFAADYTRVACTCATILAGFLGAFLRKYIFENEPPSWLFGLIVGSVVEVFHMLMVFITHMSDITMAFTVVQAVALPMIIITALSLGLSMLCITIISGKDIVQNKKDITITQSFQIRLITLVFLAFLITLLFTIILQDRVNYENTYGMLQTNLIDIQNSFLDNIDYDVMKINKTIASEVSPYMAVSDLSDTDLEYIASEQSVNEINVIDKTGTITNSNLSGNVGKNISDMPNLVQFNDILTKHTKEYVAQHINYEQNSLSSKKYSGVSFYGGILMIGLNDSQYSFIVNDSITGMTTNWHIGEYGFAIVLNDNGRIMSNPNGHEKFDASIIGIDINQISDKEYERYVWNIDGKLCYVMSGHAKFYPILVAIPKAVVVLNRDISIYTTMFMEAIVFFILFIFIYYLTKVYIVKNIVEVNNSLSKISSGDLNTVVDVRETKEFNKLSDDINATVDVLKGYIKQAEERIDKDLEFARKIQFSVLPNVFPAYPNRKEFDIFANTIPAKEVGGDFYDFFFINNYVLGMVMADVSGKGIPAAMFMMNAKTILNSLAETGMEVSEALRLTNEKLYKENDAGMFVTIWIGALDLRTGLLKFSSAGHNPAIVIRNGTVPEMLKCKVGIVAAALDDVTYQQYEATLKPGDYLYLYTDGVTEATDKNNELFGDDRLLEATKDINNKDCREVCNCILDKINQFVDKAPQFDDITMLCFKLKDFYKQ